MTFIPARLGAVLEASAVSEDDAIDNIGSEAIADLSKSLLRMTNRLEKAGRQSIGGANDA